MAASGATIEAAAGMVMTDLVDERGVHLGAEAAADRGRIADRVVEPALAGERSRAHALRRACRPSGTTGTSRPPRGRARPPSAGACRRRPRRSAAVGTAPAPPRRSRPAATSGRRGAAAATPHQRQIGLVIGRSSIIRRRAYPARRGRPGVPPIRLPVADYCASFRRKPLPPPTVTIALLDVVLPALRKRGPERHGAHHVLAGLRAGQVADRPDLVRALVEHEVVDPRVAAGHPVQRPARRAHGLTAAGGHLGTGLRERRATCSGRRGSRRRWSSR